MDILAEILRAVRRHGLFAQGQIVVVGVSGGPDSLCLLHALNALSQQLDIHLHVAHLNHQLRGADADADAQFVQEIAARWGLPSTIAARDVAALAREGKLSIEEAARQARYAFLATVAREAHSHTIAVAHHADDQVESVMMHFLRGSGSTGLRGMLPISNLQSLTLPLEIEDWRLDLVRPLLAVSRADIERYCREHSLEPRFDRSNLDTTYFRNRLRHELLPVLESYNPNIRQVIQHMADVIAAEVEMVQAALEAAWRASVDDATDQIMRFKLEEWRRLPLAMQRATLRRAVKRLRPSLRNINFVHIDDAVSHLRAAATGTRVTLPQGLLIRVSYATFSIADADSRLALPDWPLLSPGLSLRLSVPGVTPLPDSDWWLEATLLDMWSKDPHTADPWAALLDAQAAGAALSMRTRVTGDRFHPQGMPSPLSLANWMTNAKIPRPVRDMLPLIVSGDRIAWVAGHRVGQPFVVTPATRRAIRLSFRR